MVSIMASMALLMIWDAEFAAWLWDKPQRKQQHQADQAFPEPTHSRLFAFQIVSLEVVQAMQLPATGEVCRQQTIFFFQQGDGP